MFIIALLNKKKKKENLEMEKGNSLLINIKINWIKCLRVGRSLGVAGDK